MMYIKTSPSGCCGAAAAVVHDVCSPAEFLLGRDRLDL
jgi:hypothetical protein